MASAATVDMRRRVRCLDSGHLEAMLAANDRLSAPGWHNARTGERTIWGAIVPGIIRAELLRRAARAIIRRREATLRQ